MFIFTQVQLSAPISPSECATNFALVLFLCSQCITSGLAMPYNLRKCSAPLYMNLYKHLRVQRRLDCTTPLLVPQLAKTCVGLSGLLRGIQRNLSDSANGFYTEESFHKQNGELNTEIQGGAGLLPPYDSVSSDRKSFSLCFCCPGGHAKVDLF